MELVPIVTAPTGNDDRSYLFTQRLTVHVSAYHVKVQLHTVRKKLIRTFSLKMFFVYELSFKRKVIELALQGNFFAQVEVGKCGNFPLRRNRVT